MEIGYTINNKSCVEFNIAQYNQALLLTIQ